MLRFIPNEWLNMVDMVEEYTPRIEKALKTLLSCVKGTRLLYDVLISCNNILPSQQRWEADLVHYNIQLSLDTWRELYKLPWKRTIFHRFLVTNCLLFHMVLRKDDKWSFCLTERENIKDLFAECSQIRPLWSDLQEWLTRHVRGNIQLSTTDILFGKVGNNNALINHLILLTKQYIYNSIIAGNGVALNCIVNIFKDIFKVEKLSAKTNMKNDAFVKKWASLYDLFNTGL